MPTVIIEFFGTPGAGKTFVAERLAESLGARGFSVDIRAIEVTRAKRLKRVLTKGMLVIRESITDPAGLWSIVSLIRACKTASPLAAIRLVFNWLYLSALIRVQAGHSQFMILDQGLGQAFWSSLFYGMSSPPQALVDGLINSRLAILGIGTWHVIEVQADSELIATRIASRQHGNSPLDRGDEQTREKAEKITRQARFVLDRFIEGKANAEISSFSNRVEALNEAELDRLIESLTQSSCAR